MKKITEDMTIGQILEAHPGKASILAEKFQMMCLGCPHSQMETLEEAAENHSLEVDKLLAELNKKED